MTCREELVSVDHGGGTAFARRVRADGRTAARCSTSSWRSRARYAIECQRKTSRRPTGTPGRTTGACFLHIHLPALERTTRGTSGQSRLQECVLQGESRSSPHLCLTMAVVCVVLQDNDGPCLVVIDREKGGPFAEDVDDDLGCPRVPKADALVDHVPGDVEFLGRRERDAHFPHKVVARRLLGLWGGAESGQPYVVIGNHELHTR